MPSHTEKGRLLTELILEIFRVNGRLLVEGDRLMSDFRQTSSRWQVLGAVHEGTATVPTIGRRMGISRQSVQRVADLLVKEGVCVFISNPNHQKSSLLQLTDKGKELMRKIGPAQIVWVNRLARSFSENQLKNAQEVVRHLIETLQT